MIYTDVVKDTILKFLQQLFAQEHLYGIDGNLGNDFRWHLDDNQTKILIMDTNTENLEAVEKRPAIIISRAPIQWQKLAIDQRLSYDWQKDASTYSDLLASQLRINCFSRNGLEAELLATIVFQCTQFFSHELKKLPGVFDVTSVSIGEEAIVSSDSQIELSVVPVIIGLYLNNTWRVTPDGITVGSFGLTINYGPTLPDGRQSGKHETDP